MLNERGIIMENTIGLLPHIKLRFNIEHPSCEECYVYGYECALAEVAEEENPFTKGTLEHEHWLDGWWAGFYGESPLFTLPEERDTASEEVAANEKTYHFISHLVNSHFLANMLKITGALAATAIVGYQVFELVA